MRGVNIGYVQSLKINPNSVLVAVYITSSDIIIPKNSIIETSQTSLFNNTVIDIIPLEKKLLYHHNDINLFHQNCYQSKVICHHQYVIGERGLNYDDLIRATTRIAQRFDDPRLFNLFYFFMQNSLEISDDCVRILNNISNLSYVLYSSLQYLFLYHL
jgi:phospholipid/cholesterol/gamma-HCH transport system substrate-binding protein